MNTKNETFNKYYRLFIEAKGIHENIFSDRIERRLNIYYGTENVLEFSNSARKFSKKKVPPFRRMAYELVEAQIDTSIPLPRVTPLYSDDTLIAANLEEFLGLYLENIHGQDENDIAEREVRIQGACVFFVDWDELASTSRTKGSPYYKVLKVKDFIPQPHIEKEDDLEYAFVLSTTTVNKVKELYGVDVEPDGGSLTSVDLVTCWYLNEKREVSKMIWTAQNLEIVQDENNYYARKRKVCKTCGQDWDSEGRTCSHCGGRSFVFIDKGDTFELPDDLMRLDTARPEQGPQAYLPKGTEVKRFKINKLPFVIQKNISDAKGGIYGISDIDMLEETQDAGNKIINKILENIMGGGSIVTLPNNATFDNQAGTLKTVRISDVRQKNLVGVYNIQANVQQDDILNDRLYQYGRQIVGVTDSYQGKRDPTAESGRAKEISAMQTASRLESKYINKISAYSRLYKKIFEFFLAFSDDRVRIVRPYIGSETQEATFSKYNFVVELNGEVFLNNDFLFSTNGSYTLSNKKETLWKATMDNFYNGGLGNPADPRTIKSYWQIMARYDYPLATKFLQIIEANQPLIPPELEQALAQNPQLIQELMNVLGAKQIIAEEKSAEEQEMAADILNPERKVKRESEEKEKETKKETKK